MEHPAAAHDRAASRHHEAVVRNYAQGTFVAAAEKPVHALREQAETDGPGAAPPGEGVGGRSGVVPGGIQTRPGLPPARCQDRRARPSWWAFGS